ncbi:hypothetical protein AYL99_10558 [Fonsecaea erecta]|uniref:Uncharacterized protein n=1 Tax=Fonsecaea erecta TaxID=1367422 RepID=A0A178Z977_9EURO|nr:hypothetical protein AYL99_10558 [Fonsecaea erecta]OAP55585.1 hypothetical protein AYL99_10558 [Fonsecaea erecta]
MPTIVSGIEELESRQGTSNGLQYDSFSPSHGLSHPAPNRILGVTLLEEHLQMAGQTDQDADSKPLRPRLTIRELREAAQKESLASQAGKAAQTAQEARRKSTSTPQKKPSILSGLFQVREPTQVALNQVATQLIAQHGSTSATRVPNVRLEKMPDFVPRVNSKWDGVPESVRRRERREKEKEKERAKRDTFFSTDSSARSDDGKDKRHTNIASRNSSSTTGSSFGAHGSSSGSQGASSRTRFYTQSVNSSGDLVSQKRTDPSTLSPSFTPSTFSVTESFSDKASFLLNASSSAATRLLYPRGKDLTSESRDHLDKGQTLSSCPTSMAKEYESLDSPVVTQRRDERGELFKQAGDTAPDVDARYASARTEPARSRSMATTNTFLPPPTSPLGSSRDASPTSPSLPEPLSRGRHGVNEMTSLQAALSSSESDVLRPLPSIRNKAGVKSNNAFLAGEAQELVLPDDAGDCDKANPAGITSDSGRLRIQQVLEKRPDSSRDRLGLRASMLFSDDTTPWELQETKPPASPSPSQAKHVPSTKTKFHKPFGRMGKEKEKWKTAV